LKVVIHLLDVPILERGVRECLVSKSLGVSLRPKNQCPYLELDGQQQAEWLKKLRRMTLV